MKTLHFPAIHYHKESQIRSTIEISLEQLTFAQRAADALAMFIGSWGFIIVQAILLGVWVALNTAAWIGHWDPYPFILMNLVLSTQAAVTAPIIMMSQNRSADRDRIERHNDFEIDQKAEKEVCMILETLEAHNVALTEIHQLLVEIWDIKKNEENQ